jgi:hypothetical protein
MPVRMQRGTAVVTALMALGLGAPAAARATSGGAEVPASGGGAGGAEYGSPLREVQPPRATRFTVSPRELIVGAPPSITLRIDQPDARRVRARVVFTPERGTGGPPVLLSLGQIRVGRTLRPRWPKGAALRTGRYTVLVHATDAGGLTLRRRGKNTGRATLTVKPKPKPKPAPPPVVAPVAPPVTTTGAGMFPVRGPYGFGDRFGAQRSGYQHQGVDITAATGTQIVSPAAGTIRFTDYQASAAGEYIVERLADGRDLFLAHCVRHSTTVAPGQAVAPGTPLCRVGQTGDATGPHLHFELWPSGWRDVKGTAPADPMPQLKAWEGR